MRICCKGKLYDEASSVAAGEAGAYAGAAVCWSDDEAVHWNGVALSVCDIPWQERATWPK
jgi:hypothetical protein